jgi:hypothetical protein
MAKSRSNRKRHNKRRRVSKFVNRKLMKHKSGGASDTFVFKFGDDTYTIERKSEGYFPPVIKYELRKNTERLIPFIATKDEFFTELFTKHTVLYIYLKTNQDSLTGKVSKDLRNLMNYIWNPNWTIGISAPLEFDFEINNKCYSTGPQSTKYCIKYEKLTVKIKSFDSNGFSSTTDEVYNMYSLNNVDTNVCIINRISSVTSFVNELLVKSKDVYMMILYTKFDNELKEELAPIRKNIYGSCDLIDYDKSTQAIKNYNDNINSYIGKTDDSTTTHLFPFRINTDDVSGQCFILSSNVSTKTYTINYCFTILPIDEKGNLSNEVLQNSIKQLFETDIKLFYRMFATFTTINCTSNSETRYIINILFNYFSACQPYIRESLRLTNEYNELIGKIETRATGGLTGECQDIKLDFVRKYENILRYIPYKRYANDIDKMNAITNFSHYLAFNTCNTTTNIPKDAVYNKPLSPYEMSLILQVRR